MLLLSVAKFCCCQILFVGSPPSSLLLRFPFIKLNYMSAPDASEIRRVLQVYDQSANVPPRQAVGMLDGITALIAKSPAAYDLLDDPGAFGRDVRKDIRQRLTATAAPSSKSTWQQHGWSSWSGGSCVQGVQ